ncbi:MAG: DUF1934 domain-containing protein [Clostridia bacterium]|nr:DUF1934 domain-containing protein [Clostridia bacterium]
MMYDAVFTIIGTQMMDGERDTIESVTVGRFGERNGEWLLCYEEPESFGMAGVQTKIYVKQDGTVSVLRDGAAASRLVIQQGKKNICFYPAPQGQLALETVGETVENRLNETGGRFFAGYILASQGRLLSQNTIEIRVARQEDKKTCQLS